MMLALMGSPLLESARGGGMKEDVVKRCSWETGSSGREVYAIEQIEEDGPELWR